MIANELLDTLLEKRGIKNRDVFLNPHYERDFHDPFLLGDMKKACERILEAIEKKEKIVIYADYDCDGIPGAVMLSDLFKKIGYKNYEVYIPQRNSEGYGLNIEAIKQFINQKVGLLITVDLGISAVEEVKLAEKNGVNIIITDHHIPPATLPPAFAILNPKVAKNGISYPEKMLCGAGVVFKLIQALVKDRADKPVGWEKWLLDMAGLATLSDRVPLLGENRAIAHFGMKVMRKSPRPGLQKMLAKMNIDQQYLSEDDIGFMLAPRLNAASRMDDPMRAFEILSTTDEVQAGILADHLSKINDERKTLVASIMREANKKLGKRESEKNVIVIGNNQWRVGVLGLVAGKISDTYQKPVFVWGKDENDCIKGSCRSDGSVSVVELMGATGDSFLDFGGHELAGGFTLVAEKVHFLEEILSESFEKLNKRSDLKNPQGPTLKHDLKLSLADVNMKHWKEIEKLAPFGMDNPKPVFLFEGVKVEKVKKFGKNGSGEHLEIIFSDPSQKKAVAVSFFSGLDSFKIPLEENKKVNLLATFDLSRFRGREELRLRVIDIM
ncbi:MAG TPA: single-stranded-DNA-specific exonuclease RecJ [Candidatus Paceibacterota bacterium]